MQYLRKLFFLTVLLILTGCSTIHSSVQMGAVYPESPWGIATFVNNTETPQAGGRATSITANLLRARGVVNLVTYQPYGDCSLLTVCPNAAVQTNKVLNWAKRNKIRYVMMGAVNEWQYKVGLDGEPVVAVSLQLYDAYTGRVIWSSVGSKIGCSRSGLGNTAQSLIDNMLSSLRI